MLLKDGVRTHPKVLKAGAEAAWLWVAAIDYSRSNLLDGFVPHAALMTLGVFRTPPAKLALVLVSPDVGLFEQAEGGYRVHDFLAFNDSAAEVKAKRDRDSARKRGGVLVDSSGNPDGKKDARAIARERVGSVSVNGSGEALDLALGEESEKGPSYLAGHAMTLPAQRHGLVSGKAPSVAFQCRAFRVPMCMHEELLGKLDNANEPDPGGALQAWYVHLSEHYTGQNVPADVFPWLRKQFDLWRPPAAPPTIHEVAAAAERVTMRAEQEARKTERARWEAEKHLTVAPGGRS